MRRSIFERFQKELQTLKENSALRTIKNVAKESEYIFFENKKYINLSSNDYLGIGNNRHLISEFFETAKKEELFLGATSSRLLTGGDYVFAKLEKLLEKKFQSKIPSNIQTKALLFNSGYHANVGVHCALLSKNDVIFQDKLNHASIIDGTMLSGAKMFRYKHLDYKNLENLLQKHRNNFENAIISTETVFSMDGDICDLKKLIELKEKYDCILIVDEAHAFGLLGENSLGVSEMQDCIKDIDLIIGTFGKAIGSYGAFVFGNKILIEYLKNKARSFIFSTMFPPINAMFSIFVIENVLQNPNFQQNKKKFFEKVNIFKKKLEEKGFCSDSKSQIVPIVLGSNEKTISVCEKFQSKGFFTLPIRHPTVALNSSRIRISLRCDLDFEKVYDLVNLI